VFLLEYEGKRLFREYGIPTPDGLVVRNSTQALGGINFPVVIKAQTPAGGRSKKGGIRFARSAGELRHHLDDLLGFKIGDTVVESVLVEEQIKPKRELYLSLSVDRTSATLVLAASPSGGVDVEGPNEVSTVRISPFTGLQDYAKRFIVSSLKVGGDEESQIDSTINKIYRIFTELDALLVEINPLALLGDGTLVALDAKIWVDDYCVSRHPILTQITSERGRAQSFEEEIRALGMAGTAMEGNIAVVASGAGCLLSTIDQISSYGGRVGAAVDLAGSVFSKSTLPSKLSSCFKTLERLKPRVLMVNAFFQLADSGTFAESLVQGLNQSGLDLPVVLRLKGNMEGGVEQAIKGRKALYHTRSFEEACRKVVEMGGGLNLHNTS
jgi:succinyl-CoA synthetase beta subunit